jgi:hypothetical protein
MPSVVSTPRSSRIAGGASWNSSNNDVLANDRLGQEHHVRHTGHRLHDVPSVLPTGIDRLAAAWALFLAREPRRGEIAGLCWDAVDLDAGSLQVVRTLISVDGKALDSIPKTGAGRRTIPLDASLVALLRTHGVAQKAARLRAGEAWQGRRRERRYQRGFSDPADIPLTFCLSGEPLRTPLGHSPALF